MPRKSPAALAVIPVVNVKARVPEPPRKLTATQLEVWRLTVESLPSDWFTPEHAPLLAAYCRHVDRGSKVEEALECMGPHDDDFEQLCKLAIAISNHVASLGRALRLNPNTRTHPEVAAHKVKRHIDNEAKPWARVA